MSPSDPSHPTTTPLASPVSSVLKLPATKNYFHVAKDTYQGLTNCQALRDQNHCYENGNNNIASRAELKVAVRCACPSAKQMENGVISLLTYMVTWNDTVTLIGEKFGVDVHSLLDANMLSWSSTIYPFTPILVPLKHEICTANPAGTKSLCPCSDRHHSGSREISVAYMVVNGSKAVRLS
ncbi:hypothetical protein Pyn_39571 [Prunus yedoensis var. nudiflora]|uniref:LysM domain-containing protein n=1 Tax=Prunus yedoensis var. nudiflora TaxID=2094558 RepID=A0A314Z8K6_PRUYE|nr:hypothetical protein Pyn_39571 [Prunus yedoensis var. nudiflora]